MPSLFIITYLILLYFLIYIKFPLCIDRDVAIKYKIVIKLGTEHDKRYVMLSIFSTVM